MRSAFSLANRFFGVRPVRTPARIAGDATQKEHPLHELGKESEGIVEQISSLGTRLADLNSLSEDFAAIVAPVSKFVRQHTQVQTKLAETEGLLGDLRSAAARARSEAEEHRATSAKAVRDLSAALAELRTKDQHLTDVTEELQRNALLLRERQTQVDQFERAAAVEEERNRVLTSECQGVRQELEETERTNFLLGEQLAAARDAARFALADQKRLQENWDELSPRAAMLKRQAGDLEVQLQAAQTQVAGVRRDFLLEQAHRQKLETKLEAQQGAHETELSALGAQAGGLAGRVRTMESILNQTREEARDKGEALRMAERALKDSTGKSQAVEHRLELVQEEVRRYTSQLQEVEDARTEALARSEMLRKALAAKEVALEVANGKSVQLSNHIDELSQRFEQERSTLEGASRRLQEELQSERSERSLMQGALEIARSSRAKLISQLDKHRKDGSARTGGDLFWEDEPADRQSLGPDNVHPFKSTEREG